MTSDAKVGLLLGLVFIFIIAFLINGLPTFRGSKDNTDMTSIMLTPDKTIGINSEDLAYINNSTGLEKTPLVEGGFETDYSVPRYKIPLDEIGNSAGKLPNRVDKVDLANAAGAVVGAKNEPAVAANKVDVVKVNRPKVAVRHVVRQGESLSSIALKYYGPQEGNKLANIKRIFNANRRVLKSMDEVFEGQKLVIPPLSGSKKSQSILDNPLLERVKSIGRIGSLGGTAATKSRYYTVREGDSLWRISTKLLNEGKRYKEILKLNSRVLPDEDSLKVGMRLRIPAR